MVTRSPGGKKPSHPKARPMRPEQFFSRRNLQKLLKRPDREAVIIEINQRVQEFPFFAIRSEIISTIKGVDTSGLKEGVLAKMKKQKEHFGDFLRHIKELRFLFTDDELREVITKHYKQFRFSIFMQREHLERLFSGDFFDQHAEDLFKNPQLRELFLLFNADKPFESFSDPQKEKIEGQIECKEPLEVEVGTDREPGFACGGLEDNFISALRKKKGVVKVNGIALGKYYHRKAGSKEEMELKASLVFPANQLTTSGSIIWRDYAYSASMQQHAIIAEAIQNGEPECDIPNIRVRPVRPLIGVTSKKLFRDYKKQFGKGKK